MVNHDILDGRQYLRRSTVVISRREICFVRMYCQHTRVMHINIFMPVDEVQERAFLHLFMHATYSSCSFYTSTYR